MVPKPLYRFLQIGGAFLLCGLLLWVFSRLILTWFSPFLAGFLLAAMLEPLVLFLTRRLHLPRWVASGLSTLLLALFLSGGLFLLLWRLWGEAEDLLRDLPGLLAPLSAAGTLSEYWSLRILTAAPPELRPLLQNGLAALSEQAAALPAQLSAAAADQAAAVFAALPRWGLGLFTTVLATYFSSAGRPALLAFLWRQVPEGRREDVRTGLLHLRNAALGWLRAQGLLTLLTFFLLLAGLFALGVESPLLPAAVTALTDALPVLGAGLVLVPWSVLTALSGDLPMGLGLLGLWGLVMTARSLLEPKLVGLHAGLPPLAALLAMFVGFQALGVVGMVLTPLALMLTKALHDAGLLHLWRD
ncbi:sporulation integral membrane protein YtvI [uncultured Intestinimonas sp.]|uniref:sporulation integral membrane protein YtvI n=1 Tax=uncultured Intestinimonas sp. TaxID=1689265 RepID=UPI0025F9CB1C|nr:sporulation integral membrane protein YtvI [uncultured Intestinimonas sp.]